MNSPYLISSNSDALDFVAALDRAVLDGRPVEIERLSDGNIRRKFKARIIGVTPAEDRCVMYVGEDENPRSYWIRFLFLIVDADGKTTHNKAAIAKQQNLLEQREKKQRDADRALVESQFVPEPDLVTSSFSKKITGSRDGKPCDFFLFEGASIKATSSIVYAKTELDAVRCMKLLDSSNSIWDLFACYLQAQFVWPVWLNLRKEIKLRASEVRAGQLPLSTDASWQLTQEREELYKSNGLSHEELGRSEEFTLWKSRILNYL